MSLSQSALWTGWKVSRCRTLKATQTDVYEKAPSGAKKDGTDKLFNEIRAKLQAATGNRDMLKQIRSLYAEEWGAMPARWHEILENEYEDAMDSCREAAE